MRSEKDEVSDKSTGVSSTSSTLISSLRGMLGFKGVADNEEPALLGGAGGSTLLEFGVVAVVVAEGEDL